MTTDSLSTPDGVRLSNFDDLVLASINGDQAAFNEIANQFSGPLIAILSSKGNRSDAEEAAQEAWLAAWDTLSTFDPRNAPWRNFRANLILIAKRKLIDRHRRRQPENLPEGHDAPDDRRLPSPESDDSEGLAALRHCIEELTEDFRRVFQLLTLGVSRRMVAQELQIQIGTVDSRHNRARSQLIECAQRRLGLGAKA